MFKFQQEMSTDMQLPWSVIIATPEGEAITAEVIYGRPDAHYLVGFAQKGSYEIEVTADQANANPSLAIGLCPVFQKGGEMFVVDLRVKNADDYEAPAATVQGLRDRELELREVLDR